LNVQVDEAFAQIEVQLKRRADLIPNLVETVKGYASHEREALEKVVQARAASTTASTLPAIAAADGALTKALRGLLAVAEAYPDLKASANFLQLQEELATTENKVSFARQFYNETVRTLNTAVKTIPTSFFVGLAKVGAREFYEVDDPAARNAPNVKF
jgi:LemA protein